MGYEEPFVSIFDAAYFIQISFNNATFHSLGTRISRWGTTFDRERGVQCKDYPVLF